MQRHAAQCAKPTLIAPYGLPRSKICASANKSLFSVNTAHTDKASDATTNTIPPEVKIGLLRITNATIIKATIPNTHDTTCPSKLSLSSGKEIKIDNCVSNNHAEGMRLK